MSFSSHRNTVQLTSWHLRVTVLFLLLALLCGAVVVFLDTTDFTRRE